ncbi:Uncharacterised protein [Staphylococcus aureus]|nr:Uncharacterised protein [Staphylococcus aureus]
MPLRSINLAAVKSTLLLAPLGISILAERDKLSMCLTNAYLEMILAAAIAMDLDSPLVSNLVLLLNGSSVNA